MKVLFIAAEFPPVNTTGNYRIQKFIKKLPEFGIEPVVISLPVQEGEKIFGCTSDFSLLDEIPDKVTVIRIPVKKGMINRLRRNNFAQIFFSLNDRLQTVWGTEIEKQLPSIIQEHDPKAIFISFPPFSLWQTAVKSAQKYRLPLIADMRDLWAAWGSNPHPTRFHYFLKKLQERKLFLQSEAVLCVTPQLRDIFIKTHPSLPKEKFKLLSNGFDFDLGEKTICKKAIENNSYKIGYIGSFYYSPKDNTAMLKPWYKRKWNKMLQYVPTRENWLYRSPYFFLKTLEHLFLKYPFYKNRLEFHFAGTEPQWLRDMVKETGLTGNYHYRGFLNSEELKKMQGEFDAYLATSEKVTGGEHYCLPSKLFQYLRDKKPVLGFVTPGTQLEFLSQSGISKIFNPEDIHSSAEELHTFLQSEVNFTLNEAYLKDFEINSLTKQLTNIIFTATSTSDTTS